MITKYENICAVCGRVKEHTHHTIYGRGLRELADQDNLTIPLCGYCHGQIHTNGTAGELSKMVGQLQWEKEYILEHNSTDEEAREAFRKRYGRSYL